MFVESIVEKISQKGKKYFLVVIDGEQAITWSESILQFKNKELPSDWKMIEKINPQGQVQKQLTHEGESKPFQKGKFYPQKSAEEIEGQKQTMLYAYAKDLVVALITAGVIKSTVDASKWYLDIFQDSYGKISGKKETPQEETIKEPF